MGAFRRDASHQSLQGGVGTGQAGRAAGAGDRAAVARVTGASGEGSAEQSRLPSALWAVGGLSNPVKI